MAQRLVLKRAVLIKGVGEQRGTTERCTVILQGPEGRESNRAWKRLCSQSQSRNLSRTHSHTHSKLYTHTLAHTHTLRFTDSYTHLHTLTSRLILTVTHSNIYMHSQTFTITLPRASPESRGQFQLFLSFSGSLHQKLNSRGCRHPLQGPSWLQSFLVETLPSHPACPHF